MRTKRIRRRTGALGIGLVAALSTALSGQPAGPDWHRSDAARAQMDVDVVDLPPQVQPPAPGDTDWPSYNRTLEGERYSPLSAIDAASVGQLEEACRVRIAGPGPFSAGTLLANGMLYTTSAQATVAIEPTNCEIVWKSIYTPDQTEIYNANRGVAHAGGRLFRSTGDGRLVAYDAMTGRELWRVKIAEPDKGEYTNAAPIVWQGLVFIGKSGGDLGIQGRMMAHDAQTGREVWHFNLIPSPGEFGHETWPGDTWKTGGGGTWSSYTLDPATGELFVPVANPAPAFDPHIRKGANLFTNSAVVLDAKTGRYLWHYHDNHDYGVSPPGILVSVAGKAYLAQASKDGFVYMIDRATRRLAWKAPVTTILNFDADATPAGVRICPGAKGGVEYNSPGYDPASGVLVVGAVDWCYVLVKAPYPPYAPGNPYLGGRMDRGDPVGTGWITALDARSGKVRWRYRTPAPVIGAVTPTAGGITFAGDASGALYVFRTATGELLRTIQTGGAIAGGIITYRIRGQQYVAVGSGNISRSSWSGATGIPTMIVYRLPGAKPAQADPASLVPDAARGRAVYAASCTVCHGAGGQGGEGPPLRGLAAKYTQAQAVAYMLAPGPGMPKFFPDSLGAQDIADVAAHVRSFPGS
jgi:PQQ-dependent dehydrogenase (methanol/ethanol family)